MGYIAASVAFFILFFGAIGVIAFEVVDDGAPLAQALTAGVTMSVYLSIAFVPVAALVGIAAHSIDIARQKAASTSVATGQPDARQRMSDRRMIWTMIILVTIFCFGAFAVWQIGQTPLR